MMKCMVEEECRLTDVDNFPPPSFPRRFFLSAAALCLAEGFFFPFIFLQLSFFSGSRSSVILSAITPGLFLLASSSFFCPTG